MREGWMRLAVACCNVLAAVRRRSDLVGARGSSDTVTVCHTTAVATTDATLAHIVWQAAIEQNSSAAVRSWCIDVLVSRTHNNSLLTLTQKNSLTA